MPEPRPHIRKMVPNSNWVYFHSYMLLYGVYVIECPSDRRCQVGGGVKWFGGEPAGERRPFSGSIEFNVWGMGNIHIRVDDGLGPCEVSVWLRVQATT